MKYVQFRIHPGVGIARMGNSLSFYSLTSEIPMFLQEEFPKIRHKPVRLKHPLGLSWLARRIQAANNLNDISDFKVFDDSEPRKNQNNYKDGKKFIYPQAARFRVFAYVYDKKNARWPKRVVEVTAEEANIEWGVSLSNRKKGVNAGAPDVNASSKKVSTTNHADIRLRAQNIAAITRPSLATIILERSEADVRKPSGRLHVVGNIGESKGPDSQISAPFSSLWFNNWDDSAADGEVTAKIRPLNGGTQLRTKLNIASSNDMKFLKFGTKAPANAAANAVIDATPAWCVVGLPNYVPDMGHFVSLWDLAFAQGEFSIQKKLVSEQDGNHKLIRKAKRLNRYKWFDYRVHIQPQLCLFTDVNETSSMTRKSTGVTGHKKTPSFLNARNAAEKTKLMDPKQLTKKNDLKRRLYDRLRQPSTLYRKKRFFIERAVRIDDPVRHFKKHYFPRYLGRRVQYEKPTLPLETPNRLWDFPHEVEVTPEPDPDSFGNILKNSLRLYHTPNKRVIRPDSGLCGRQKFDPDGIASEKDPIKLQPGPYANRAELKDNVVLIDDEYWPATEQDMPLLRELAYTHIQERHFRRWSKGNPRNTDNIWRTMVNSQLETAFNRDTFADEYFDEILNHKPKWAPALIDQAHLGSMLGGSFLPGIEAGREGGRRENWCILEGGTKSFPDIRFRPVDKNSKHNDGTLTKDLAIPWQEDFQACNETYWPTSRPGEVRVPGVPPAPDTFEKWLFTSPLSASTAHEVDHLKNYWTRLGFVRRKPASNEFEEQEADR